MKRMLFIFAFGLIMLFGCGENKNETGIEIGFEGSWPKIPWMYIGVKSDKRDFSIENITLDFYYGWTHHLEFQSSENSDYIGLVITFCNRKYLDKLNDDYTDYKQIEGQYIVKELKREDYYGDEKYLVETGKRRKLTYNHHELFTVPKEVLNEEFNGFTFMVRAVFFRKASNEYFTMATKKLSLSYEWKDDQNIYITSTY